LPSVSPDGLTWTFHLKAGIRYAPPLQGTEIIASDYIRSLERIFSPASPSLPFGGSHLDDYFAIGMRALDVIAGAREYAEGTSTSISGLQSPDPHTLVINLTHPDGALGYLMARGDTLPIPANPFRPTAPLGVAEGHNRFYGTYWVSSGPYMIEGADAIDFSKPPEVQFPPTGEGPEALTLVRNPSWDPKTDRLRTAYPDRLEFLPVDGTEGARAAIQSGRVDVVLNWDPSVDSINGLPPDRLVHAILDIREYVSMNLGVPPFDDLHVRRAANFAVDRQALVDPYERVAGPVSPTEHIALDSEEDNLLLNYRPWGPTTGDLEEAKAEMAQSRYDANGDGLCDIPACSGVRLVAATSNPVFITVARGVRAGLAEIGIDVDIVRSQDLYGRAISDPSFPRLKIPMIIGRWAKDYPSATTFFPLLFESQNIGGGTLTNWSMVGASAAVLRKYGYAAAAIPSVDDRIADCNARIFADQVRCWSTLDQYLTTQVVPWIPLLTAETVAPFSSRVSNVRFDQSTVLPRLALDNIAVAPIAESSSSPSPSFEVPPIPDGVYQTTITKEDFNRFDPRVDPSGLEENTGRVTIFLRKGLFRTVQTADHPISNPVTIGRYTGSGDLVVFEGLASSGGTITTPPMRWTFDGTALHLSFLSCAGLHDPENPAFCSDTRVLYEAHAWVKVG
jgi:peptide/nickel transport system substrate-binding protein